MTTTMTDLTYECPVHFERRRRGARKELEVGPARPPAPPRVPRVAKLLALAHRIEGLIRDGAVKDQAEVARLGHVTRARVSQIMSLLHLAPEIQEAILHLPPVPRGRDPVILRQLLPIAATPDWTRQRRMWWICMGTDSRG